MTNRAGNKYDESEIRRAGKAPCAPEREPDMMDTPPIRIFSKLLECNQAAFLFFLCYSGRMENEVRQHFRFSGRVQGVGFRYTAQFEARSLSLSGWVKNCADGSVELEAQGDAGAIAALVKRLRDDRFIRIESTECHSMPLEPSERGFRICF